MAIASGKLLEYMSMLRYISASNRILSQIRDKFKQDSSSFVESDYDKYNYRGG